ncbi:hypothetical protein [Treponema putidum]|uniref:Uncharacterized protein n=1 Tax=Treponema putidum TaxID=221027 RepID=A0ABY5HQA1_9SPIR|nr:hypothetical protein [Treponema putidum]UTY27639.1 hypothetical protein E4N76_00550 [Treponema putidum]
MAKKLMEVLNTSGTEILEEKKDGEGVDAVDNPEKVSEPQNSDGIEKNDTVVEQSNEGGPTGEKDLNPTETEQTGKDTGSNKVNQAGNDTNPKKTEQTGKDKKNPKGLGGKKLIRHTGLKNSKVIVFDGSFVEFDEEGIAEVDDKYAEFLLQIPGYESVIKEVK